MRNASGLIPIPIYPTADTPPTYSGHTANLHLDTPPTYKAYSGIVYGQHPPTYTTYKLRSHNRL